VENENKIPRLITTLGVTRYNVK